MVKPNRHMFIHTNLVYHEDVYWHRTLVVDFNTYIIGVIMKRVRVVSDYERSRRNKRVNAKHAKLKRNGRCIMCGITDERTENGKSRCTACNIKNNAAGRKWYKKVREERLSQGLCVRCGKCSHEPGKKFCTECVKIYTYYNNRKKEKRNDTEGCV